MRYRWANTKIGEPQIITLEEPIKMMGVGMRTDARRIFQDSQTLGKQYQQVKQSGRITRKKDPWAFVAVSRDFHEDGSWEYLMGDVVTTLSPLPDGLTGFEIPAKMVAKFTIQPRFPFLWGAAIGLTKKFIYTEWLPSSGFEPDSDGVGDFEYHDARSLAQKPEIDLFVMIKKR